MSFKETEDLISLMKVLPYSRFPPTFVKYGQYDITDTKQYSKLAEHSTQ
jgi:hypothetical protein